MSDTSSCNTNIGPTSDDLRIVYTETSEMIRTYVEWRHKLLVRFLVVTGSLSAAAAWLYETEKLASFATVPLFLAVVFSVTILLTDIAIVRVMWILSEVGESIEQKLLVEGCYICVTAWWRTSRLNATVVILCFYVLSAVVIFVFAVYAAATMTH